MTELAKPQENDLVGTKKDRGIHQAGEASRYSEHDRALLRALGGMEDASDADLDMLHAVATRSGLDPFAKEIYLIGRKTKTGGYRGEPVRWETKWTVQAGIDGLRKVLNRWVESKGIGLDTGNVRYYDKNGVEHLYWHERWGNPDAVIFEIRAGESVSRGIAPWTEFVQTTRDGKPNSMWSKMPGTMLSKCAEAQAIRRICSLTSGVYIAEEIQDITPVQMESRRLPSQSGGGGLKARLGLDKPAEEPAQEQPAVEAPKPEDDFLTTVTATLAGYNQPEQVKELMDSIKGAEDISAEQLEQAKELGRNRWNELSEEA